MCLGSVPPFVEQGTPPAEAGAAAGWETKSGKSAGEGRRDIVEVEARGRRHSGDCVTRAINAIGGRREAVGVVRGQRRRMWA